MIKKRTFYIYPFSTYNVDDNSYMRHFTEAFSRYGTVLNLRQRQKKFRTELLKYFRASAFAFNWPEHLAFQAYPWVRIPIFVMMTILYKLCRKKIIWVFHNKHPHKGQTVTSKWLMKYMAFISNLVITHAEEGVEYCKKNYYKKAHVLYVPHPIYPEAVVTDAPVEYDIVIWGAIKPYKNIVEFLKYYRQTDTLKSCKVLLCGRCNDASYNAQIEQLLTPNIDYRNDYIATAELNRYLSAGKVILFTYDNSSVLSSGALTYSLSFKKKIVGPSTGSFKDLEKAGLITTYRSFQDIEHLLTSAPPVNNGAIDDFIQHNGWNQLAERVVNNLFVQ